MDKHAAMEILRLYRPGTADDQDPKIAEALALAKQDPELARWLEAQSSFYLAMRDKLKQIPVPPDLKRQILRADASRRTHRPEFRNALIPLAAAALIALLAVAAWTHLRPKPEAGDFAACRERIVMRAQRGYSMSMTSSDLEVIHHYIQQKQYPDYALTKPLAKLTGEGCATLDWHDQKISMVCLKSAQGRELFLFAMDRAQIPNSPATPQPQFAPILHLMTASWSDGDKIYILAGSGDEADLKQFLN